MRHNEDLGRAIVTLWYCCSFSYLQVFSLSTAICDRGDQHKLAIANTFVHSYLQQQKELRH